MNGFIKVIAESVESTNLGETVHLLLEQITGEGASKRRAAILENVAPEMRSAYRDFMHKKPALKQVLVNGTMADLDTVADGMRRSVYFDMPNQKMQPWSELSVREREEYLGQAEAFMAQFVVLNPPEVVETGGE